MAWAEDKIAAPSSALAFAELRPLQGFVLLGELGVGKTWLFDNEAERLRAEGVKDAYVFHLGEFSDTQDLEAETFSSPAIGQAIAAGTDVYLFFDSLDQGVVRIDTLDSWLLRKFQRHAANPHVHLRVSSRMVIQALSLADRLAALYQLPVPEVAFFVGALTRSDIEDEIKVRGLDAPRLIAAIRSRNAELLAAHPITLTMLLDQYGQNGRLSDDIVELYRTACKRLAEEHDTLQFAGAPVAPTLAYTLTGRIAAIMAATGSALVSVSPSADRAAGSIAIEEIASLPERVMGRPIDIADQHIRYVLTNGHFQTVGQSYRWTHVSLQDFMSAEWMSEHLHPDQILALLVHPLDGKGQIRPELEELAAWLAGTVRQVRDYLLRVQPLVLLTTQSQAAARAEPKVLLSALMTPENAMRVRWLNVRDVRLKRLRYPDIALKLRKALSKSADQEIQWFATAIVRQLQSANLDDELFDLVTSHEVAEFVAVSAGLALALHSSPATRRKLADRLRQADSADLPDEIKAVLLRATWPRFISAETLFSVYTPPRDDVLGLYDTLSAKWILSELKTKDLEFAIRWVGAEPLDRFVAHSRVELIEGIMRMAADHLGHKKVRSVIAALLQSWSMSDVTHRQIDVFAPLYPRLAPLRQIFADALNTSQDPDAFARGIYWQTGAIFASLSWLLEQYAATTQSRSTSAWVWLIERVQPATKRELERLKRLARVDPALAGAASSAHAPLRLPRYRPSSHIAAPLTRSLAAVDLASIADRLEKALDRAATDIHARFDLVRIIDEALSNDEDDALQDGLTPQLTRRLQRFLKGQIGIGSTPQGIGLRPDPWLQWSALAYFLCTDPNILDQVPTNMWSAMAGVMLSVPDVSERGLEVNSELVARIVKEAPKTAQAAVSNAFAEPTPNGIIFTRKLRRAWNSRLTAIAMEAVTATSLPHAAKRDVLASLLTSRRSAAMKFALRSVSLPVPEDETARSIAVVAAQALLATGEATEFDAVWPLIRADPELGLEILGADAPHSEGSPQPLVSRLNEDQLATLYVWLSQNSVESRPTRTAVFIGPKERIDELARHSLDRLRTMGTPEAVTAIENIRKQLPDAGWLRLTQDAAERSLRMNPSIRPTPLTLLRLADDHAKRYISSETDLLEASIASLDGLEAELIGDDPLVRFIWKTGRLEPRDEIDLTIFIAGYLRRDLSRRGVVLNREVNVSRVNRTDIRVEAVPTDGRQRSVALTIEVKGSWHPELSHAMETQLRDRYLAQGTGKVGLYLVGWFRTEGVYESGPAMTIDDARTTFAQQAAMLSEDPFFIKAYVLDCRWREELPKPSGSKPPSRRTRSAAGRAEVGEAQVQPSTRQ